MGSMIKNLLFDLGGVLIDCDLPCACEHFSRLGITNIDDYLNLYHQNGFFLCAENGELDRHGFNEEFRRQVGHYVSDEAIDEAWLSICKNVNVEKLRWMENHRSQFRFYLLSNINPYVFEWAATEKFSADRKPLGDYFDKMFASYQLKMTKPSKEIFQYVIDNAPLKPEETLYIDDGQKNIERGKQMKFVTYQPKNGENWIAEVERIIEMHQNKE